MQIRGSVDRCDRAARDLQRAAAEVSRTAGALQRAEVVGWAGTSAQGWGRLSSLRVCRLRGLADVLAAFGRAVHEHAEGLEQLQDRTWRLRAQAAEAGLVLDADGWIRPVPLPEGSSPELLRDALQRQEARRRVLAAVAVVREHERDLHDRLRAALAAVHDRPAVVPDAGAGGLDVDWLPGWWDLPAGGISVGQIAAELTDRLPRALRHAGASGGLGFGVGVAVDRQAGRDWDDALTKNLMITGGTAVTAFVMPAAAPVVVVVGAGAGAGYLVGRVFDAVGHHLPWVDKPRRTPDRAAAPRFVGPMPLPPAPRPSPGPTPTPARPTPTPAPPTSTPAGPTPTPAPPTPGPTPTARPTPTPTPGSLSRPTDAS